jgi:putative phosphoribosyl transferase
MVMSQLAPGPFATERPVRLDLADVVLNGDLALPPDPRGLVVFAHGSGSSRHSSRNRAVAEILHQGHFGTLLLDLLTDDEERTDVVTAEFRFDIVMLGDRVVGAIDWAGIHQATQSLPLGLFGASTGAAAALIAAARRPKAVRAVVSRGGRPDLAGDALRGVTAPTLLIVGGRDEVVIDLNRQALAQLNAPKDLQIVPDASHLFEEPGTLARAAQLASDWFERLNRAEG